MLFEWVAPPECPSEHEVAAHVTSLAGETLTKQPLRVWGHIERVDTPGGRGAPRYHLELRVGGAQESPRTLESDECGKLANAAALIVALDLQARATEAPVASPPAPSDVPPASVRALPHRDAEPIAKPKPPAEASEPHEESNKARVHGGLGGAIFADHGTLDGFAWAGSIFGFVAYRSIRVELEGALWPAHHAFGSPAPGGATITLRTLGVRGCWTSVGAPWLDACLHFEGGALRAAGFGVAHPETSTGVWLGAFAGLAIHPIALGPLRPRITFELGTPMRYPTVSIEGIGRLERPDPLVVRLGIGLATNLF